jgi:putative ATPase
MALPLAVATKEACEFVGQPECELNLAHAVIYLATAPKSNSATAALGNVKRYIKENAIQSVPKWLQDSHSKVSRQQGQGEGYLCSHDYPDAVSGQEYMHHPKQFYTAGTAGREKFISERLQHWRELKAQIQSQTQ